MHATMGLSMERRQIVTVSTYEADKEYWGLQQICHRMRWKNRRTPVRQALKFGFPLYLRTKSGQKRQCYYSNEKLITAWEWCRCEREIERLLSRILPEELQILFPPSS
jgi:hypothetical protein